MTDWLWRLAFATVWFVLFAVGAQSLVPTFVHACDDCIGSSGPGDFGEGGFIVDWVGLVFVSVLIASVVTVALMVVSRAIRGRLGSVV
jgi:hypothetical protein